MSCKTEAGIAHPTPSREHGFADNVGALKRRFDYPDGLDWNLKKGKKLTRIESDDPVATATLFAGIASEGFVSEVVGDKGYRRELADGTIIGLRIVSSSDGSPAVDLNITNEDYTRKIHFVKEDN